MQKRNINKPHVVRIIRFLDHVVARSAMPRPVVFVSGFWRSGTTWLQWLLAESIGAKTIFEPFSPLNQEYQLLMTSRLTAREPSFVQAFFPYLDGATSPDAIMAYLARSFRGYSTEDFTLLLRSSWRDSLRRGLVLKCVRCALSHTAIQREFSVPVVHIRRNPYAMISSLLQVDWRWSFDEVSVHDLIHGIGDGREQLFGGTKHALRKCDRYGAIGRIAAYWALMERYVDNELADKEWARIISYEDLVSSPEERLDELQNYFRLKQVKRPDFDEPMPYTRPGRRVISVHERIEGWKQTLTAQEIETIRGIVSDLYPEYPLTSL